MEDKRRYIRVNKSLTIGYRPLKSFYRSGSRCKNISEGGICLPIFQSFEIGTQLELEIVSEESPRHITAIGKLVWITRKEDHEYPFEAGIEFIKILPDELDKLRVLIKTLVKKEDATKLRLLE
jgi:Tfp pilus assembly protein PilZ